MWDSTDPNSWCTPESGDLSSSPSTLMDLHVWLWASHFLQDAAHKIHLSWRISKVPSTSEILLFNGIKFWVCGFSQGSLGFPFPSHLTTKQILNILFAHNFCLSPFEAGSSYSTGIVFPFPCIGVGGAMWGVRMHWNSLPGMWIWKEGSWVQVPSFNLFCELGYVSYPLWTWASISVK